MSSPVDPNSELWRDALAFARDQAKAEIDNIERLYSRSVRFLGYLLLAVAAILTFLGWTTYNNLRGIVIATTKSEMDTVVKEQIADQLKRENVEAIVRQTVTDSATAQLHDAISQQVSGAVSTILKSLRPEISQTAIREAKRIVSERMAPRHLTGVQREALRRYLQMVPHKYMLQIVPMDGDPEEREFTDELAAALKASGWQPVVGSPMGYGGPQRFDVPGGISRGVFLVVRDLSRFPAGAQELLAALSSASINTTVAKSLNPVVSGSDAAPEMIDIVVGPK